MKYGMLTEMERLNEKSKDGRYLSLWLCDCGKQKKIPYRRVIRGGHFSCGCFRPKTNLTHGQKYTSEYNIWSGMKARCHSPSNKDYPRYGAKGISVCQEWIDSFEAFKAHVGPRPIGTTLDRINTKGNYEPGNVRWASANEQARNRPSSFIWKINGMTFQTSKEASIHFGITEQSIHRWVKGFTDKRRNNHYTPPKPNCYMIRRYE